MWLLESAKDWILAVDPLGQQVSSHIRYETTCLIIRNTIYCVSFSGEWGMAWFFAWDPHGARVAFIGEILALQAGPLIENRSTSWHSSIVDLYNNI
jgi:hypothetical protein